MTQPANPTDSLVAQWGSTGSTGSTLEQKNTKLEIAAGALAKDAVQAVKSYLDGGFTVLLTTTELDKLEKQVVNMSWSSNERSDDEAAIMYDKSTGHFAVLIIEQKSSSKVVKFPYFGATTHTAKLKYRFKRMQALNDAAHQKCQTLVNEEAEALLVKAKGDLVRHIEAML